MISTIDKMRHQIFLSKIKNGFDPSIKNIKVIYFCCGSLKRLYQADCFNHKPEAQPMSIFFNYIPSNIEPQNIAHIEQNLVPLGLMDNHIAYMIRFSNVPSDVRGRSIFCGEKCLKGVQIHVFNLIRKHSFGAKYQFESVPKVLIRTIQNAPKLRFDT